MSAVMQREEMKLLAHQKKSGLPYEVTVTDQHVAIIKYLLEHTAATDGQLQTNTELGKMDQAGARRCELRDAGMVEHYDYTPPTERHRRGIMTWSLTLDKGRDLARTLGLL